MILNMVGGGGGAGLNFSVVGGTTQPTGRENLIWVDTDTAITDWLFSTTQPTTRSDGTALSGGEIWFKTGNSSAAAFNALKKHYLGTYPAGCKQYVSGTWVSKTAKTYQNGEWIDWVLYLYIAGDECSRITGGWGFFKEDASATGTKNSTSITIASAGGFKAVNSHTTNPIDLTDVATLKINATSRNSTQNDYVRIGVSMKPNAIATGLFAAYADITETGVTELNVSNLTGSYYVIVFAVNGASVTFDLIKCELGA